eukprot:m.206361 g.206361  ORF g.206361 m.206361 type:complete len:473 (-) comp15021_c0_seq4:68-1486(-)
MVDARTVLVIVATVFVVAIAGPFLIALRINEGEAGTINHGIDGPMMLQLQQQLHRLKEQSDQLQQLQRELKRQKQHGPPDVQSMQPLESEDHNDADRAKQENAASVAKPKPAVTDKIHAFYYPWYETPQIDGQWRHWNHELIAHWDSRIAAKYKHGQHRPPDDLGSSFYPQLGPYSSRDPQVIAQHMQQLHRAGVGVVAVSWYPPNLADENGSDSAFDPFVPIILKACHSYGLQVALHIEPFANRNEHSLNDAIVYITEKYGGHPAMAKMDGRPLLYAYDSYQVAADVWAKVLTPGTPLSIRNTKNDAFIVGLLVEAKHKDHIRQGRFDGFYTYFATNGFTYGSSYRNWNELKRWSVGQGIAFIPSIGPGYDDTAVRPWNAQNTRKRDGTRYYDVAFQAALSTNPQAITITSFNEWHEGTQIEPAIPKVFGSHPYKDYGPSGPSTFLDATKHWACVFARNELQGCTGDERTS